MAYCKKCGAYITKEDEFCGKCGTKQSTGEFDQNMDKKDLLKKLDEYRLLLDEYEYLKDKVKPQESFPSYEENTFKKRSFIRYFWPFLVIGLGAFYLIYMAAALLGGYNKDAITLLLGILFAIIAAVIIIVFGFKVAKRKQAEVNREADMMNEIARERVAKADANQRNLDRLNQLVEKKYYYDPLVPEEYRDFDHVAKIEELIMQNKADTIEEACSIITK